MDFGIGLGDGKDRFCWQIEKTAKRLEITPKGNIRKKNIEEKACDRFKEIFQSNRIFAYSQFRG